MSEIFSIETSASAQSIEITREVGEIVERSGIDSGLCHIMVLHSTAAVVVNETHDPNIGADVIDALERSVPLRGDWRHDRMDDNAAAHIKASILGPQELVPVSEGRLALGTWQGILLLEFDGPRKRRISVKLLRG